jgi:drug/metabolite transporter (DMT)-like permease
MGWLPLALLTGALVALRDALVKRGSTTADEYTTIFTLSSVSALLLGSTVLAIGVPEVGPGLGVAIAGSAFPNLLAYLLLAKSVKLSDLSLVTPLLGLTPLFLLVTSPIILGERAGPLGIVGVVMIVAGAYLLNARDIRHGVLEPFRALLRDRGARLMLGVAFLWSISANYDRVGVEATSVIAWPAVVHAFAALTLAPVVLFRRIRNGRRDDPIGVGSGPVVSLDGPMPRWLTRQLRRSPLLLVLAGAVNSAQAVTHMTALTMTLVPYVVAVKRTSLLFSVGLGHVMFGERRIRERALGALVILAGVVVFAIGR